MKRRQNCETKPVTDVILRNVGEVIIPPEKRDEMLNKLRKLL